GAGRVQGHGGQPCSQWWDLAADLGEVFLDDLDHRVRPVALAQIRGDGDEHGVKTDDHRRITAALPKVFADSDPVEQIYSKEKGDRYPKCPMNEPRGAEE